MLKKWLINTFLCLYTSYTSLIKYRELFISLYKREFITRTTGTALSFFWLIGQQVLQVVALWFLIDVILKVRYPGETPFLSYFLVGMIPWLMIMDILQQATGLFNSYKALFKRTIFPLEILPLLTIAFSASTFFIVYVIVIFILNGWFSMLLSIPVFIFIVIWLLPMVYFLSIIGVFIKDINKIIPFILTMLMYVSPILYMPSMVPDEYRAYLVFNPISDLMIFVHSIILQYQLPDSAVLIRLLAQWLLLLGPAWMLFKRAEKHIRDIV